MAGNSVVVDNARIKLTADVDLSSAKEAAKEFIKRMVDAFQAVVNHGSNPFNPLPDPGQAGQQAGQQYAQSLNQSINHTINNSSGGNNISQTITQNITNNAQHAGQVYIQQFGQGVTSGAHGLNSPAQQISNGVSSQGQQAGQSWIHHFGTGVAAGVAAIGLGKLIASGLDTAADLQSNGAKLQATLGLDPEQAKKAGKIAGDLYRNAYGDSLESTTDAVEAVVGSLEGFGNASDAEITKASKAALNLATLFGGDVSESVQLANQLVKNGLANTADEAFDLLTTGLQKVPAALRGDLTDAIDEYSPFLKNLGYTGQQAFDVLIKASSQGKYGIDKTGDALKELSIRATDMSKTSVTAYQAAGLNATEMAKKFQQGGATGNAALKELVNGLLSIQDPVARSNAAIGLFGTPLEDLATSGGSIDKFLQGIQASGGAMDNFAGSATKADKILNNTAKSTLTGLQRQFQITLGEALIPILQIATPLLQQFASFLNDNKTIISQIAGPALIFGTLLLGIIAGINAYLTIAPLFTAAIGAAGTAFGGFSLALSVNPIFLIIAAIIALIGIIVLLAQHWDEIGKIFALVGQYIAKIIDYLVGVFNYFAGFVQDIINGLINLFADFISYMTLGGIDLHVGGGFSGGGSIPQMANGGVVKATPGGTLVNVGEAGRNEAIVPLDDDGTIPGDNGRGGNVYNIDATGYDPDTLARVLKQQEALYG